MLFSLSFYFIYLIPFSWIINISLTVEDDATRNVTELITSKGYGCENYEVITSDGFVLSLQRIQKKRASNFDKIGNPQLQKANKANLKYRLENLVKSINDLETKYNKRDTFIFNDIFQKLSIKKFLLRKDLNYTELANKVGHFFARENSTNTFPNYIFNDLDRLFVPNSQINKVIKMKMSNDITKHRNREVVGKNGKASGANDKSSSGNINTSDGIIGKGGKNPIMPVVYLQHGLLDSATTWVINPANESLGFVLADEGFDVWLGNSRGNTYSRKHTKYLPDEPQFWDFTYDEMALIDLPAIIEFIVNKTLTNEIHYIGHSQGGLIGLVGLSQNKYLACKISNYIGLAPAAYVDGVKGVGRYLMEATILPDIIFKIFGIHEFLPNSVQVDWLVDHFCSKFVASEICQNILFLVSGFNEQEMNKTRIPVYVAHTPAGTSVKNIVHYSQVFKSKQFRKYDYGSEGNMIKYNQTEPPLFNLSNIHTPVNIFAGDNDYLADPKDIRKLMSELKSVNIFKEYPAWAHLDFVWGYRPQKLIRDILHIIKKFKN